MTRIEHSDAQLDAEAAAPDRDLEQAILLHRLLYKADLGILKLHQRDGESGLGPPFAPAFEAFLDGRYGGFPWRKAESWMSGTVCRRSHVDHDALCQRLVYLVIRREWSLNAARLALGLPSESRSRRVLDSALLVIERRLEQLRRNDQPEIRREPVEWMAAEYRHHAVPGLHAAECEQCRRAA